MCCAVCETGAPPPARLEADPAVAKLAWWRREDVLDRHCVTVSDGWLCFLHDWTRVKELTLAANSCDGAFSRLCAPQNELETVSTLRFGQRAKQIQNRPQAHVERSVAEYKMVRG